MTQHNADAVIVGGGLAGVAAAIAVAKAGLNTIHLSPAGPVDRRTSALMMPSVDYLSRAGLIEGPDDMGHKLTQIRIIDATHRLIRAPETLFDAQEVGLDAFGWNFTNVRLMESFQAAAGALPNLETRGIGVAGLTKTDNGSILTLADGTILAAPFVVGADGKKSLIRASAGFRARESAFSQAALVCDLQLGRPIGGTSIEFHDQQGPFTLVPAGGNRASLVWIDDHGLLREALAGGEEVLVPAFLKKSQRLFGTIAMLTPAQVFPLGTLTVDAAGADGVVLVGEAAHTFPPIGAQGLNLGLRDVADLAQALQNGDLSRPDWAAGVSLDYSKRRAADMARTGSLVDTLFRSLLAEMIPAQALRASGLWALKLVPGLRQQAFGIGMGER